MIGTYLALLLSVTDGDTFKVRIEIWPSVEVVTAVRIMGIDTPEIHGKCVSEKAAALKAKARLTELLTGKQISLSGVKFDKYAGRIDAVVMVDRDNIGALLIQEGLAHAYDGKTKQGWCP